MKKLFMLFAVGLMFSACSQFAQGADNSNSPPGIHQDINHDMNVSVNQFNGMTNPSMDVIAFPMFLIVDVSEMEYIAWPVSPDEKIREGYSNINEPVGWCGINKIVPFN